MRQDFVWQCKAWCLGCIMRGCSISEIGPFVQWKQNKSWYNCRQQFTNCELAVTTMFTNRSRRHPRCVACSRRSYAVSLTSNRFEQQRSPSRFGDNCFAPDLPCNASESDFHSACTIGILRIRSQAAANKRQCSALLRFTQTMLLKVYQRER